jgi:hypothetical protein
MEDGKAKGGKVTSSPSFFPVDRHRPARLARTLAPPTSDVATRFYSFRFPRSAFCIFKIRVPSVFHPWQKIPSPVYRLAILRLFIP